MPEMPDVLAGEVIEVDWGNDLRDRSVQRYASSATRAASVPSPVAGDLSFLQDTGLVYVYTTSWVPLGGPESVDGFADLSGVTTGSYANIASTVSLTIPSNWDQWKCVAWASWTQNAASGGTYNVQFSIDGTTTTASGNLPNDAVVQGHSWVGARTGMTTTGARTIALQAKDNGPVVNITGVIYTRATRTA